MPPDQAAQAAPTPTFTHDWFSPHEAALRQHLWHLRERPVVAVEIGCYEGRATLWFLDNILIQPGSWITCIDTFDGSAEHKELGLDFSSVRQRFEANTEGRPVTTLVGTSAYWLKRLDAPFHLAYVDGSHLAPDVLVDSVECWRLLVPGGIMVWDDYGWNRYPEPEKNPKLAIDSFLGCYRGQFELLHADYRVIVRKL